MRKVLIVLGVLTGVALAGGIVVAVVRRRNSGGGGSAAGDDDSTVGRVTLGGGDKEPPRSAAADGKSPAFRSPVERFALPKTGSNGGSAGPGGGGGKSLRDTTDQGPAASTFGMSFDRGR